MTSPDPDYFAGWEQRLGLDEPATAHVWCRCGHVEATHWVEDAYGPDDRPLCKAQGCDCTEWRPKRRKNRIKHWLTGRG